MATRGSRGTDALAQVTSFEKGGTLSLVVSDTAGYDPVLDDFNLEVATRSTAVPEPEALALLGLGLMVGVVTSRRLRRRR